MLFRQRVLTREEITASSREGLQSYGDEGQRSARAQKNLGNRSEDTKMVLVTKCKLR